jgi:predicted ATPase
MIFEDAHWADPTSLEVVSRIVDRLQNLRVLLIVTFRPEFDPPWIGRPYVTAVTLNRLPQREIETVIDNVVGNKLIRGLGRPRSRRRSAPRLAESFHTPSCALS